MTRNPNPEKKYFPEEALLREVTSQSKLIIGIPCEDPRTETRLGLTPEGVSIIVEEGHIVKLQRGAGLPMSYTDLQYSEAGAVIVDNVVRSIMWI